MRPHGRARVSQSNPQAFGICDRCGFLYNRTDLQWQFDWAGASLINRRILVCDRCNDDQQQQLRAIVLPADPVPIVNPRPQDYVTASSNVRLTSALSSTDPTTGIPVPAGEPRATQDSKTRSTQQTGEPPFGINETPGIDDNVNGADDPGLPYNNTEVPETGPLG